MPKQPLEALARYAGGKTLANSRHQWPLKLSQDGVSMLAEFMGGRGAQFDGFGRATIYMPSRRAAEARAAGLQMLLAAKTGRASDFGIFA